MSKQYTRIPVKISSVDEDNYTLNATFSTNDMDRHGDEVEQNWILDNFMDNPVVINSHNYEDATEVIGRVENLINDEDKLDGKIKFAAEESKKARQIFDLYKGGFLNAFSVGFMPREKGNELLEVSAVSIPANAMATAKQKGYNVDALEEEVEKDLDKEKKELEAMFKEGRVLSQANYKKIEKAYNLLGELIEKVKSVQKSPECRMEGETEKECVERKIPEIMEDQDVDEEQAAAIAFDMCSESCEQAAKSIEEDESDDESEEKQEDDQETEDTGEKEDLIEGDETEETEEESPEEDKKEKLKKTLMKLHQETDEAHEGNLDIKKRKIHRALREVKKELEA